MKVIFGIGNPGKEYESTRHNVGYEIIDRFTSINKINMKLKRNWLVGTVPSLSYALIKPLSFVNESGRVAKNIISTYEMDISDFLVVVDDFAIPLGTLRMRTKGSSGGHKGLDSIIYQLESSDFPRLRIGIGPRVGEAADFVLSKFKKNELKVLDDVLAEALHGIKVFLTEGINQAMEFCNQN